MPYCHCGRQIEDFDPDDEGGWLHVDTDRESPTFGQPVEVASCGNPYPENE